MSLVTLTKELVVLEDLDVGTGTVEQSRGTGTQISGAGLPYSDARSINEELDTKETTVDVDSKLALKATLNGDPTELFKVAVGISEEDAVNKSQLDELDDTKADISYVDSQLAIKADEDNVLLKDGTSPVFTPVSPNQPTTKKYVDDLLIEAGAGDMLKGVYDTGNTGAVDTTEAIGRTGTFLGQTPMNQVMRLSQSNVTDCDILSDFGIFIGTDVANAPVSGEIGLEQLDAGGLKAQRLFSFDTNQWYDRQFTGIVWTGWSQSAKTADVVARAGDTMTGNLNLLNNVRITSPTTGGNSRDMIYMATDSTIRVGNSSTFLHITSSGTNFNVVPMTSAAQGSNVGELTRKDYVDSHATFVGMMTPYNGLLANVPANWQVCDGTNGTADMTNAMILGTASEGEIGDTGGSNDAEVISHRHTGPSHTHGANHNHSASSNSTGSHTHTTTNRSGTNSEGSGTGFISKNTGSSNSTSSSSGAHSHTITVNTKTLTTGSGGTGNTSTTGVSGTDKNLPAYVKFVWIQRMS